MARPRSGAPKRVVKRLRDGTVWYYFYDRATGRQVAKEPAGANVDVRPGTLAELIAEYRESTAFKRRKPGTQDIYCRTLNYLNDRLGDLQVSAITPDVVQAMKESLSDSPSKANQMLAILSILFKMAVRRGRLQNNPAANPGKLEAPRRTEIWSREEEDRVFQFMRPSLRLAFMLLLYTLQRPSDVLAMTIDQVTERDGRLYIALCQQKTGTLVGVPVHANLAPLLRERLAQRVVERRQTPAGAVSERVSNLLVPSPRGLRWTRWNFSRAWDHDLAIANSALRKQLVEDGLREEEIDSEIEARHRQRRDLRRTGIVRLAEAGATTPQIAAISGHAIDYCQRIIDTYLPRRTEVALGGIKAWERGEETGPKVVRLPDARQVRR